MSLVTGIDLEGWSAVAATGQRTNGASVLSLDALYNQGLPDSAINHCEVNFELQDLQPCSVEEYAYAMAIPDGANSNHGAWVLKYKGSRIVLPALVLIRALVGQHPTCFSRLFRPQSLDDICEHSPTDAVEQVRVTRLIGRASLTDRAELRRRLTWFTCFPSARIAWASVYGNAKLGRLDITLPRLTINGWFSGQRYKNNFYATKLQIQDVAVNEKPFDFAPHCPTNIEFIGKGKEIIKSMYSPQDICIPMRGKESSLTDIEWERIRPIFSKDPSQETSRRELLDAILLKWSKNLSWRAIEKMQGKREGTTSAIYYKWRIDGRFAELLGILNEMRSGDSTFSTTS